MVDLTPKLFLGMTTTRRSDWEQIIAAPIATRSKKPDSVEAEILEKKRVQEEQAHMFPFTAAATSIVILDEIGNCVLQAKDDGELTGATSALAMAFLENHLATYIMNRDTLPRPLGIGARLFGFDIKERMRTLAMDALRYTLQYPQQQKVPSWLWASRMFDSHPLWCDPYEVIVPSEHRNNFPWANVVRFLGGDADRISTDFNNDAYAQAEASRQLAKRAGLI